MSATLTDSGPFKPGSDENRPGHRRPVVLFVAEAVTLAHYARLCSLSRALDPLDFRVVVAADRRFAALDANIDPLPLHTVSASYFAEALARGRPLYDTTTLSGYVEADLALLDRVRPDLVVGDFRLSLAVSAPLRQVPYAAIVNAYWSPYAETPYPVPDLPATRMFGVRAAQWVFDRIRPMVFALHARPLNRIRRRHGLPSLGHDLRRVYTWGDYTWYADIPEVIPTLGSMPVNHRYLGPVLWSAGAPVPAWWNDVPDSRPIVCLTLGSSGDSAFLPGALQALAGLPITLLVATAGASVPPSQSPHLYITDYLPLEAVLRRASLLICNGGSLTTYQAMACGVPVIGVCSNMDQLLNMQAMQRLGCGVLLRAGRLRPGQLAVAVARMLQDPAPARAATLMGETLARYDSAHRFRELVSEILPAVPSIPR